MADLAVFVGLVVLIGLAGVVIGILAARRIGAWEQRRAAAADPGPDDPLAGSSGGVGAPEHGGERRG